MFRITEEPSSGNLVQCLAKIPWSKVRLGRAADHSPSSSAAVTEQYSYTSTHPLGHTGPVTGSLYLYLYLQWFKYCITSGCFRFIIFCVWGLSPSDFHHLYTFPHSLPIRLQDFSLLVDIQVPVHQTVRRHITANGPIL